MNLSLGQLAAFYLTTSGHKAAAAKLQALTAYAGMSTPDLQIYQTGVSKLGSDHPVVAAAEPIIANEGSLAAKARAVLDRARADAVNTSGPPAPPDTDPDFWRMAYVADFAAVNDLLPRLDQASIDADKATTAIAVAVRQRAIDDGANLPQFPTQSFPVLGPTDWSHSGGGGVLPELPGLDPIFHIGKVVGIAAAALAAVVVLSYRRK